LHDDDKQNMKYHSLCRIIYRIS